jgi:hypothetical protein
MDSYSLIAISIVAIASAGFVAESIGNLSDSDDFPSPRLPTAMKLPCAIADVTVLDSIKSSFLSRFKSADKIEFL